MDSGISSLVKQFGKEFGKTKGVRIYVNLPPFGQGGREGGFSLIFFGF